MPNEEGYSAITGQLSQTIKPLWRQFASIRTLVAFLISIQLTEEPYAIDGRSDCMQLECLRVANKAKPPYIIETFHAEINYQLGIKIKIDVSTRQVLTSKGLGVKLKEDEARELR